MLPRGGALPPDEWRRRNRALLGLLWLNVLVLPVYGVVNAGQETWHDVAHSIVLVPIALLASTERLGPKLQSVVVSLGLLSAAARLVHLTGGITEAHFYFFVLIVALTLYEDWLPFLVAVAFVLLHHGVVGMLTPEDVFSTPGASSHPWARLPAARWDGAPLPSAIKVQ